MRLLNLKALALCILLCVNTSASSIGSMPRASFARSAQKRDKVIATKTIKGKLKGFEVGDYVHAVITLNNGKEESYFIGTFGLDYFLAQHKDEPLVLTYQIVDSYIPEAGGVQRIERLSSARAGTLTSAAWWKKMRAKHTVAQLEKMYGGSVEKLRLNP